MKNFTITDDGDSFDLALFQDGVQVGGAMLPIDFFSVDDAHKIAQEMGEAFQRALGGYPHAPVTAFNSTEKP